MSFSPIATDAPAEHTGRLERIARGFGGAGLVLFSAATPFSIALAQSGLFLAGLSWAFRAARARRWLLPRTPFDLPVAAYVAAECLAAATAIDRHQALLHSKRLLLLVALYLAAEFVRRRRDLVLLFAPLAATSAALSALAIGRYLSGPGGLERRIQFTTIYMTTAGILMITLCLGLGLLVWGPRGRHRWGLGAACLVIAVCLVFTYTRSAWLGFLGALGVMALFHRRRWPILAGAALFAAAAMLAAPAGLRERALSAFNPRHPLNVERVHMWSGGLRIWRDHPLTGVGDLNTAAIYREYMSPRAHELAGHFHNNLIHLAVTLGLVGLLAVGWLFWRILRYEIGLCRRTAGSPDVASGLAVGALGALAGFAVAGLFEWNLGDAEVAALLWFTVGLAVAAGRLVPAGPRRPSRARSARDGC